jgi:hypothetical protein
VVFRGIIKRQWKEVTQQTRLGSGYQQLTTWPSLCHGVREAEGLELGAGGGVFVRALELIVIGRVSL